MRGYFHLILSSFSSRDDKTELGSDPGIVLAIYILPSKATWPVMNPILKPSPSEMLIKEISFKSFCQ